MKRILTHTVLYTAILFAFSGCWLCPEPPVEYYPRDHYNVVTPPDSMLLPVKPSEPPKRREFVKNVCDGEYVDLSSCLKHMSLQIKKLGEYNVKLLGDITKANNNMKDLREWKKRNIELYKDKNDTTVR